MKWFRYPVISLAVLALSGCAMVHVHHEAQSAYQRASAAKQSAKRASRPTPSLASVRFSNVPYVDTAAVPYTAAYPAAFSKRAVMNAPAQPVWRLMQQLESVTGYSVRADDDLLNRPLLTNGASLPPPPQGADSTMTSPSVSAPATGTVAATIGPIVYDGTVKGLLDAIADQLDATWTYNHTSGEIHFWRYALRSFHLATLPGSLNEKSEVGSTTGQAVQGGRGQTVRASSSKSSAAFGGKYSVWKVVESNLQPLLSPRGHMTINEATASVVVYDRWDHLDTIAAFIHHLNHILSMEVRINVAVYRVEDNDSSNNGIDWNLLYNALKKESHRIGLNLSMPRPTASGLSTFTVSSPNVNQAGKSVPFAGSQLFFSALSTLGKTSVVTRTTVSTVNNTPAPVRVYDSQSYLAETTSLYTGGSDLSTGTAVGAGATLEPGNVETGFHMQVLPSVQPDGHRLLLEVALSLSSLDSMKSATSGGEMIQLPDVSGREVMERTWMRSGQSFVITGYGATKSSQTTNTPFGKGSWMLGGNRGDSRDRDGLVIVVTPVVRSHSVAF